MLSSSNMGISYLSCIFSTADKLKLGKCHSTFIGFIKDFNKFVFQGPFSFQREQNS